LPPAKQKISYKNALVALGDLKIFGILWKIQSKSELEERLRDDNIAAKSL
jgi:hypothetical protein